MQAGVSELASVSLCIADGPEGWVERWLHNDWGYFPDAETAWSMVPESSRRDFRLYAYAMLPVEFGDQERPLPLIPPEVEPPGDRFRRVGWDAVSRSTGHLLECSPLSCNGMLEDFRVNSYCLFDDRESAVSFARRADALRCEPGPYHVVEVWRYGREGVLSP